MLGAFLPHNKKMCLPDCQVLFVSSYSTDDQQNFKSSIEYQLRDGLALTLKNSWRQDGSYEHYF